MNQLWFITVFICSSLVLWGNTKKSCRSERKQAGLFKGGGGANGIRTSDTRIFSPMLYQLSYGTFFIALTEFLSSLAKNYFVLAGAKVQLFPIMANFSESFFLFCSRKPMLFDVCHLMVTENIVSLRFENF